MNDKAPFVQLPAGPFAVNVSRHGDYEDYFYGYMVMSTR